jgi:hypothetical protein
MAFSPIDFSGAGWRLEGIIKDTETATPSKPAVLIAYEIKRASLTTWRFPHGNKAHLFRHESPQLAAMTVQEPLSHSIISNPAG